MDASVLVVEDDPTVRETVTLLLERAGFEVCAVGDGQESLDLLDRRRFDLVVLDVMLPGRDGFEVCRAVRRWSQVPIVMLTARTDTVDVVTGLELGADDYLTKPFQSAELLARVRAALRRPAAANGGATPLKAGDLEVDPAGFTARLGGRSLALTTTELRLLVELMEASGRVLSREVLLERVWGYDYLGDSRLVDMAVKRLRDKLGDDPRRPRYVATVRGAGYRFDG